MPLRTIKVCKRGAWTIRSTHFVLGPEISILPIAVGKLPNHVLKKLVTITRLTTRNTWRMEAPQNYALKHGALFLSQEFPTLEVFK